MAHDRYERLSGLDNSFLLFEGPNTPMHVAAIVVFENGTLARSETGLDVERIRAYVHSRLDSLPRYRQRLAYVPIEQRPVWVADEHFDLNYHVRHSSLPRPGNDDQLRALCARILERQLDRARPLWETWFIEGLQGNRFAMLTKVHHCMVDGVGGVDLLAALLRPTRDDTIAPARAWACHPAPLPHQLLWQEIKRGSEAMRGVVGKVGKVFEQPDRALEQVRERAAALWQLLNIGLRPASRTPLNQPIGPHRRVDWVSWDLADVKAIRTRLGGTINDVVLATVAGAMRAYLERRGVRVAGLEFRAVVPVNVRAADEGSALGNHVSAWITSLPIAERDPTLRLAHVRDTTARLKDSKQSLGVELLTHVVEWTSFGFLASTVRLAGKTHSFNVVVTNVPGPQFPLYLLGAPMVAAYPHVPLFENQGLGLALFSYSGKLFWGFNGDWDLVPDLADFVNDVAVAFDELRRAAMPISVTAPAPRRAASQRIRLGTPQRRRSLAVAAH